MLLFSFYARSKSVPPRIVLSVSLSLSLCILSHACMYACIQKRVASGSFAYSKASRRLNLSARPRPFESQLYWSCRAINARRKRKRDFEEDARGWWKRSMGGLSPVHRATCGGLSRAAWFSAWKRNDCDRTQAERSVLLVSYNEVVQRNVAFHQMANPITLHEFQVFAIEFQKNADYSIITILGIMVL